MPKSINSPTTEIIERMELIAGCDPIESVPALESLHNFGGWTIPGTNFRDMRAALSARFGSATEFTIVGVHVGSQLVRQAVADIIADDSLHHEEQLSEIARVLQLDQRGNL